MTYHRLPEDNTIGGKTIMDLVRKIMAKLEPYHKQYCQEEHREGIKTMIRAMTKEDKLIVLEALCEVYES